jgi:hypothetical protein
MPGNTVQEVIMRSKLFTLIGLSLGAIAILYPLFKVLVQRELRIEIISRISPGSF